MTAAPVDYAHTPTAQANRTRKAVALATAMWHLDLHPWHEGRLDEATLARLVRRAGYQRAGAETWAQAWAGLAWWESTSSAPRLHTGEHTSWCATDCPWHPAPAPVDQDEDEDGVELPPMVGPPPRGWDTIASLPPLDPRAVCFRCFSPAVIQTPYRARPRRSNSTGEQAPEGTVATVRWQGQPYVFRCGACYPTGNEWGARLDWTHRPEMCLPPRGRAGNVLDPGRDPVRHYCGRCNAHIPPVPVQVVLAEVLAAPDW